MKDKLDADTELRMKELLCQIVDNKLFPAIQAGIEGELAMEILRASKSDERDDLHAEHRMMTRFFNRLSTIANEVRTLQNARAQ